MSKQKGTSFKVPAVRAKVLGVRVYRGFASLADLADFSKADIYDQKKNPKGTQRDLNPAHARKAYEYVKNSDLGFWPEIFLCARKQGVIKFTPLSEELTDLGVLEIDTRATSEVGSIAVSRWQSQVTLRWWAGRRLFSCRKPRVVLPCGWPLP